MGDVLSGLASGITSPYERVDGELRCRAPPSPSILSSFNNVMTM